MRNTLIMKELDGGFYFETGASITVAKSVTLYTVIDV